MPSVEYGGKPPSSKVRKNMKRRHAEGGGHASRRWRRRLAGPVSATKPGRDHEGRQEDAGHRLKSPSSSTPVSPATTRTPRMASAQPGAGDRDRRPGLRSSQARVAERVEERTSGSPRFVMLDGTASAHRRSTAAPASRQRGIVGRGEAASGRGLGP